MIASLYGRVESVGSMLHFGCGIFEVGFSHLRGKMHNYHFRSGKLINVKISGTAW